MQGLKIVQDNITNKLPVEVRETDDGLDIYVSGNMILNLERESDCIALTLYHDNEEVKNIEFDVDKEEGYTEVVINNKDDN